ncbi:MAG: sugar-binding protein [Cytophagaceae bacterium]
MRVLKAFVSVIFSLFISASSLLAQRGYFNAPYIRYEANAGVLTNAAATPRSYAQGNLQSEASEQVCVNMSAAGAAVQWTMLAEADGLVVRYSIPDGQTGALQVFANGMLVGTMNLTSYYSWEYLWSDGNPNNTGVVNTNPKMRFDEVRMRLPSRLPAGGTLRLVRQSGNIHLDFAEMELVANAVTAAVGDVTYTGNGSDLQTFINNNGGRTIYLPAGVYNVNRELYFGANNTILKGAGMWYTQIHFTNGSLNQGGLRANASNVSYSGLYLTTVRNSRSNSYKAINGVYTAGSTITNVWAEHFECGAWIGQYNAGAIAYADGFTMSHCRFRNNYADGINLCRGTRNAVVQFCNFRNNGDDDMAIWSADGMECQNNTFRYNTSEHCWRASGCAIYGGYNNRAHNLLIVDNLEVGLRANNTFPGVGFSTSGMQEFYDITIIRCGTYNDLYYRPVGAIDLLCTDRSGTRVNNVRFSCISIIDSKNDAIYINRSSGEGFYNLVFENIYMDGTGREVPNNDATNVNGARGFFIRFAGNPAGHGTYCNMTYLNRGGNATTNLSTTNIGSFSFTQAGSCPGGCVQGVSTTMTSPGTFGVCNTPVTLTATAVPPSGNTISHIEFFVNGTSIGVDNTSPYSISWNNPAAGIYQVRSVAHFSPSGTSSSSAIQEVVIADGIYNTATAPVIDGNIDAIWGGQKSFPISKLSQGTVSGPADLSALFKITRDAANLYILVDVTDDILRNDGTLNWEKDAIEIFIDMGNDKAGAYGANDFQYTFVYNTPTVFEARHNAVGGVVFAQGAKAGGYVMEIRIPWATLGGAPASGTFMGIDVHVNDNDSGTRNAKIAWNDETDNAWQNTALLGTLQIAGCNNPLPVEFINFEGQVIAGNAELSWITASEINNKKFVIQRSSDLNYWDNIGEITSVRELSATKHYSFVDSNTPSGLSFYRLMQVDFDGNYSYSSIITLSHLQPDWSVFPNPFTEELTIRNTAMEELWIDIFDLSGKLIFSAFLAPGKLDNTFPLNLNPGVYTMLIRNLTSSQQVKLINNRN